MSRPLNDGADYFPKDCGFYRDDLKKGGHSPLCKKEDEPCLTEV